MTPTPWRVELSNAPESITIIGADNGIVALIPIRHTPNEPATYDEMQEAISNATEIVGAVNLRGHRGVNNINGEMRKCYSCGKNHRWILGLCEECGEPTLVVASELIVWDCEIDERCEKCKSNSKE